MNNYVVGDIQGCLDPLKQLLDQVNFNPEEDTLWSVGDIVNRGPASLQTLRFVKDLNHAFKMVLGNHDLHLLALYHGVRSPSKKDTLNEILDAPDVDSLCHWLQQQPLLRVNENFALVHAGIPHIWSVERSAELAKEVEHIIQGPDFMDYFSHMYGDTPSVWSENLEGPTRWRVITNYLTRMRFCNYKGVLDFRANGPLNSAPESFSPWYSFSENRGTRILFGHWAALEGALINTKFCALDTGCVWGGPLRVLHIESEKLHHFPA